jgi:hypothetical protein
VEERWRYLIELHRPGLGWPELDAVAAGARQAAGDVSLLGRPVRFLRSIYVPEDETCFLLYEGRSAGDVRRAVEHAGVLVERPVRPVQTTSGGS